MNSASFESNLIGALNLCTILKYAFNVIDEGIFLARYKLFSKL